MKISQQNPGMVFYAVAFFALVYVVWTALP
jgi:hypothetical protein